MKKAMVNYWVDMITGIAFLLCAVTGLFRLFPEATVSVSATGQPVILGISTAVWQTVHDWSGVVMTAGVGVHTALHLRWLVSMTGKVVRGKGSRGASRPARARVPAATPIPAAGQHASHLSRDASASGPPSASGHPRISRKGFLATAGVVGVAAFFVGFGLLSNGDDGSSTSAGADDGSGERRGSEDNEDEGGASEDGSGSTSDAASGSSGDGSPAAARVVVDASACTGCGTCVQVCPDGVFALSGGKAVVQNPDACRLCGRCPRTCAPAAITLNG